MRSADADPTDALLPPALRGRDGYVRLVQGISLRISVVGTRGKATLAAMTSAALTRRGLAVHCNAPRPAADLMPPGGLARAASLVGLTLDDAHAVDEARRGVQRGWPAQALVLANHARGLAGIRRMHATVSLPHYVLVTNVRRDPPGLVARPLTSVARDLVRSVTPGATVISGEPDPALKQVLRRECQRQGLPFLDASPKRGDGPAAELLSVLQALLLNRFGKSFEPDEEAHLRRDLEARFRWEPSSIPGVRWFNAGPIHDVDSTQIVLNHLQAQRRLPVTFVVYLRADRPGRTKAYQPFLEELLAAPDTRQVVLCGHRASAVAARLERWGSQVRVVDDDHASVPRLMRRLQFDCQGGAIVTLCNGAPEWPRELARQLRRQGAVGAAPRPPRPEPSFAVPRRIARPMVAPVAARRTPFAAAEPDSPRAPGTPSPPIAATAAVAPGVAAAPLPSPSAPAAPVASSSAAPSALAAPRPSALGRSPLAKPEAVG